MQLHNIHARPHSGGLRTNEENHRSSCLRTVTLHDIFSHIRGYIFPRCVGGNVQPGLLVQPSGKPGQYSGCCGRD